MDKKTRAKIGEAIIDKMLDRTSKHKDINNTKFQKYSKEYASEKGVGRSQVDMLLTSDMLSSIKIIKNTPKELTIGITPKKEKLKAFNHNKGDTLPKRKFFGVKTKDAAAIGKKIIGNKDDNGES